MSKQAAITTYSGSKLRIPNYEGGSISKIPSFVNSVLSVHRDTPLHDLVSNNIDLGGIKNIVFFLVDGFGYAQWKKYSNKFETLKLFEAKGSVYPIDTVFPSSTPVALTTLQSNGRLPADHGLLDWWLYIQGIDNIIATLPYSVMGDEERDSLLQSELDPKKILYNGKTMYEALAEDDIESYTLIKQDYAFSAYSNLMYKGAKMVPHQDIPSLFTNLGNLLNKATKPSFFYVYWGDIDSTGHSLGLDSKEYLEAATTFFEAMKSFITSKQSWLDDTLFVVTADHGQVNVDRETTTFLDEIEGFNDLLKVSKNGKTILPWGGPREVFIAVKNGETEKALAFLSSRIGDRAELLKSSEVFEAGLFGKVDKPHADLFSRMGDIIIIPKGNFTVWYNHPKGQPFNFKGHHGGLSDNELQIPFAILKGKDLIA